MVGEQALVVRFGAVERLYRGRPVLELDRVSFANAEIGGDVFHAFSGRGPPQWAVCVPYPGKACEGVNRTDPIFRDAVPRVMAGAARSSISFQQLSPPRLMNRSANVWLCPAPTVSGSLANQVEVRIALPSAAPRRKPSRRMASGVAVGFVTCTSTIASTRSLPGCLGCTVSLQL